MVAKVTLNIVMGAMTFGEEGKSQARVHDIKDVKAILDVFQAHGHKEVDTARVYCGGTSEEYLAKAEWQKRGLIMETKLFPQSGDPLLSDSQSITHTPQDIRKHLDLSLKALNTDKIEMFYLHGPDRNTPYEVTLRAVNEEYQKGKFKRFGVSNYYSWEVAEMVTICRANGWIQPTAYQGVYNAIHRAVEPELFPCLRKFGISFYAYNPLSGGLLTGRYKDLNQEGTQGRFDPNTQQGKMYRSRYWTSAYFQALKVIESAAAEAGLTMAETALRWASHHSMMKREYGDSVIIGASSVRHLEQNLDDLEKGPLPEEVVQSLDEAWGVVKKDIYRYWR